MIFQELTEREKEVFLSIVHGFVKTAEPVGSRFLTKHYGLQYSPATVRNVMMDLEEKGLLAQPHTSAGRVPTNYGYRQYVDHMMHVGKLSDREKQLIVQDLSDYSDNVDQIVEKSTLVLSKISNQLGVLLTPRFNKGKLVKLDLVSLSDDRLLVVLKIKSGLIKSIIVEIEKTVPRNLLQATVELLNERLYGLSIGELQESLVERFKDVESDKKDIVKAIQSKAHQLVGHEPETDFHFFGAKNVISHPEFGSQEKIKKLLELLDRKDILIRMLDEHANDGVSIIIGDENKEALMNNCSVITTTYQFQNTQGTLGIIGPTRMQYSKIIALVEFMAETLTYLTSNN
jgi:heat-inducible transcriptional repressor